MLQNVVSKELKSRLQDGQVLPIRVKQETKQKINDLLVQINAKEMGRKVRPDDLILAALGLIKTEHIEKLKEKTLTNADKLEQMFKKYKENKLSVTKDEYIGLLLDGKVSLRVKKNRIKTS